MESLHRPTAEAPLSTTPDYAARISALEDDTQEIDVRVVRLEGSTSALGARVGSLEADRLVTASAVRKTEERLTEQLDDFRKEWRDQRKWTRQQIEKVGTEMCALGVRLLNLGELLINRMTPYPLTGLLLVAMLIGSGMAWNFVIPEWFDISAGERREEIKEEDHIENAASGYVTEPTPTP